MKWYVHGTSSLREETNFAAISGAAHLYITFELDCLFPSSQLQSTIGVHPSNHSNLCINSSKVASSATMKFTTLVSIFALVAVATAAPHKAKENNASSNLTTLVGTITDFCQKHISVINAKLTEDICIDASACLEIKATGIIPIDLKWKLKQFDIKITDTLKGVIGIEFNNVFGPSFYKSIDESLTKSIPNICDSSISDFNACILTNLEKIALTSSESVKGSLKIAQGQLTAHLKAIIDNSVDITFKNLDINLIIEQITISGTAKLSEDLKTTLNVWTSAWNAPSGLAWTNALALTIKKQASLSIQQ
ncbi:hypothetical protein BC937DRAFT_93743 [Endogone sp. FLAS-F59071]|nr:hypothetical protein BC937DRAFT_93743 [Endogone sp. FLAS-F59071]|eukprot:RUS14487.1 hypothetical protein BC937DRAFT_93743 [Endogone sp. FLAS-F59071]